MLEFILALVEALFPIHVAIIRYIVEAGGLQF
jgi:hypothetical protein